MKLIDRFISRELLVNVHLRDRGAEPGARGRKYFPETAAVAGEPRCADGIPHHVHRVCVAVLTHFHDSVGIVDGDPARLRTALRGQRIDRAARQRRERHARVCFRLLASRLVARRFVSGSMCRLRLPRRKDCAAPFSIWPRGIRWRFLAAIRSLISFPAEEFTSAKRKGTNSRTSPCSR